MYNEREIAPSAWLMMQSNFFKVFGMVALLTLIFVPSVFAGGMFDWLFGSSTPTYTIINNSSGEDGNVSFVCPSGYVVKSFDNNILTCVPMTIDTNCALTHSCASILYVGDVNSNTDTNCNVTHSCPNVLYTVDVNTGLYVPYDNADDDVNINSHDYLTSGKYYLTGSKNPFPSAYSAWNYAHRIVLNKADANLTNFPLYVQNNADAGAGAHGATDGNDVRFLDSGGNLLPCEKLWYDVSAGNARWYYYVQVPEVRSDINSVIYMLYGNVGVANVCTGGVFDSNFVSVYNYGGYSPTSNFGSGSMSPYPHPFTSWIKQFKKDSVGTNDINASSGGASAGFGMGTYNSTLNTKTSTLGGYAMTGLEAWTKFPVNGIPTGSNARTIEIQYSPAGGGDTKLYSYGTNSNLAYMNINRDDINVDGTLLTHGGTVTSNAQRYIAVTYNGTTLRDTRNGSDWNSYTKSLNTGAGSWAYMGSDISKPTTSTNMYGFSNSLRISSIVRSDAWIKYSARNLNVAGNSLTVSPELVAMSNTDNYIENDGNTFVVVDGSEVIVDFNGLAWNFYKAIVGTTASFTSAVITTITGTTATFTGTVSGAHLKDTSLPTNRLVQSSTGGQLADSGIYLNGASWTFNGIIANSIQSSTATITSWISVPFAMINGATSYGRLTVNGTTATAITTVNASTALTNNYSTVLFNTFTSSGCAGAPSTACTGYTDETNCNGNNYHGGCYWNPLSSASCTGTTTCDPQQAYGYDGCVAVSGCQYDYDQCLYETEGSCSTRTGCTANYNGDCAILGEYDCTNTPPCTGNYDQYCSNYNTDYATCSTTSGCTANASADCSMLSYPDCLSDPYYGCVDEGTYCSGYAFDETANDCSGTYQGAFNYCNSGAWYYTDCSGDQCNGTPYSDCSQFTPAVDCASYGNHAGQCTDNPATYECAGTESCQQSQTECEAEAGCTWGYSQNLDANLPKCDTTITGTNYWLGKSNNDASVVTLQTYFEEACTGTASDCSTYAYNPIGCVTNNYCYIDTYSTQDGDCSVLPYPDCLNSTYYNGCYDNYDNTCAGTYYTQCTGYPDACSNRDVGTCSTYGGCSIGESYRDKINGDNTKTLTAQYSFKHLQCNGSGIWYLLNTEGS